MEEVDIKNLFDNAYIVEKEYKTITIDSWKKVYNAAVIKLQELGEDLPTTVYNENENYIEKTVVEETKKDIVDNDLPVRVTYTWSQIVSAIIFVVGAICNIQGLPIPENLNDYLNEHADTIMFIGGFLSLFVNRIFKIDIGLNRNE